MDDHGMVTRRSPNLADREEAVVSAFQAVEEARSLARESLADGPITWNGRTYREVAGFISVRPADGQPNSEAVPECLKSFRTDVERYHQAQRNLVEAMGEHRIKSFSRKGRVYTRLKGNALRVTSDRSDLRA